MEDRKIIQVIVYNDRMYGLSDKGELFCLSTDKDFHTCWQIVPAYFNLITD